MKPNLGQSVSRAKEWWKEHSREVWLAFILAIAVAVGIEFGRDSWVGPTTYKVYLVGKLQEGEIQRVFKAFESSAERRNLTVGNIPIEIDRKDDQGDPEIAARIAQNLAKDRSTLLVVGHVFSQQTKLTLPYYMNAVPRIPVIATAETDDDLEAKCTKCKSGFVPLIQMAPTNLIQATSAVRYALERHRKRFLIVFDVSPTDADYTVNLVADFHKALEAQSYQGITIVGEWKWGPPLHASDLRSYNPDCVLFAGQRESARALINRLEEVAPREGITVILPDSAVGTDMQEDRINDFRTVVYTSPIDAAYFNSGRNVFGQDAFAIVGQMVMGADTDNPTLIERFHRFLGMHRVSDARAQIIRGMEQKAESGTSYIGETGEDYKFSGVRRDAFFHVWEVQHKVVLDIDGWHKPAVIAGAMP